MLKENTCELGEQWIMPEENKGNMVRPRQWYNAIMIQIGFTIELELEHNHLDWLPQVGLLLLVTVE